MTYCKGDRVRVLDDGEVGVVWCREYLTYLLVSFGDRTARFLTEAEITYADMTWAERIDAHHRKQRRLA